MPVGCRFHDLRHYFTSLLIASGADVKEVQARLRHASTKPRSTPMGMCAPDRDDATRAAVDTALAERPTEEFLRNRPGVVGHRPRPEAQSF